MKKWGFLFFSLVLIGILGISILKHKKGIYGKTFAKIPVRFIPLIRAPTIDVKIDGSEYSLNIDLGSSMDFVLDTKILSKIGIKEPLESVKWFDLQGNSYLSQQFRIRKIQIGEGIQIQEAIAIEECTDFIEHGSQALPNVLFVHKAISSWYSLFSNGRIGWKILKNTACFFDFPNSEFWVAKDLQSLLTDAGCSVDGFIQMPFEIESFGVILSFETDIGEKKFLLDTGSTWSLMNQASTQINATRFKTGTFVAGGVDLGKRNFRISNISNGFTCDGILGMDFFQQHIVCLDFQNTTAFIKRNDQLSDKFISWMTK